MSKAISDQNAGANGIRFTVGRDENGCWVVSDRDGLVGGLFRDRAAAVHFAMFESDHAPGAVCCVPDGVIGKRWAPRSLAAPSALRLRIGNSRQAAPRTGGR